MTKATPEYLDFELMPRRSGRRTDTWLVTSAHSGSFLGTVIWYAAWRQYTFTPAAGSRWSAGCMATVMAFIEREMIARKLVPVGT